MGELDNTLPGSEGLIDVEQNSPSKHPNSVCLNCGTALRDTFCQHCGQKDIPKRQTLGELWINFISSFWSYEGKFFLTTRYLITRPGFLPIEYNKGRRESYYHPARMYVFISFVFFFIFFSVTDTDNEQVKDAKAIKQEQAKAAKELNNAKVDSLTAVGQDSLAKSLSGLTDSSKARQERNMTFNFNEVKWKSAREYDSLQKLKPENERDGWFARAVNYRVIELNNKYKRDGNKFGQEFIKGFLDNFSKVLFYLLPIFALLLKLLYIRKDYFYSEHLVFSIYYYNFFYLAGSLQLLASQFPPLEIVSTLIGLWIVIYLLFAMKRMYQQSWLKTIVKYLVLSFVFLVCITAGLAINAIAILLSI